MNLIRASHFFGTTNILLLSVYATSWIGQDVLKGDPIQSQASKIFELGISWGSLALMFTSIIILLTAVVTQKMFDNPNKFMLKSLYILSQLFASCALLYCAFINDFSDVFIVLPFTGFSFQTFHEVPETLAELLEKEEKKKNKANYKQLLSYSLFYNQVFTFMLLPLFFLLFPDRDDNLWGILVAGACGLMSAFIAIFI